MSRRGITIITCLLVAAGAVLAPAAVASAQEEEQSSIGIRLTEAPESRRDDPRAHVYVVDHLQPGDTISRSFEVTNDTAEAVDLELYVGGARIIDGRFVPAVERTVTELASWSTVEPPTMRLEPGTTAPARVTIEVPADATDGERYGVVLAEARLRDDAAGVAVSARVGIRIYLSIGEGGEPVSDLVIDSLAPGRDEDGIPFVRTAVTNTGNRAIDLSGELLLEDGPGGVSAGPFPAKLGTTLAPGDTSEVSVELDADIPLGPWLATMTVRSGELRRRAEAVITFPEEPGTMENAVEADPVEAQRKLLIPIAAAAVVAGLAATSFVALRVVRPRGLRRLFRLGG